MEGIAPVLRCLLEVRFALENGESVRTGIMRATTGFTDSFSKQLEHWLFAWERGNKILSVDHPYTIYQRHFVTLLSHGLQGHPIRPQLLDLQVEIEAACRDEIEHFIRMMPVKLSAPLLLLQFPAFLLLILGPLLENLIRGFV